MRSEKSAFFLLLAASLTGGFFGGCMGGSDGVENPKLTLELRDENGAPVEAGTLSIHGTKADPVRRPDPLYESDFVRPGGKLAIDVAALDSALGGAGDTVVDFNVSVLHQSKEVFAQGFRYRRSGGKSGFSRPPPGAQGGMGSLAATLVLRDAVLGFKGKVGNQGATLDLYYVFVPGSPYHGDVSGEGFTIARLPPGVFDLVGAHVVDNDTVEYFRSADSLNTSDTAFSAGSWGGITLVPD